MDSAAHLLSAHGSALLAALLASVICGVVGTMVVLRRLVALAGGVAHAAFGGIGAAVALGVAPRYGAAAVALGSAGALAALDRGGRARSARQDAAIGVLWAVGMAVGMVLLAGSAGALDVEGYLFGDIARVHAADLALVGAIDLAVLVAFVVAGRDLVAVAFDPENARLQGLPVGGLTTLLFALVALSIVALLALVGVVLAIALLTIPPLVALRLCRGFRTIVGVATAVAFALAVAGLALASWIGTPAGPTIVLAGGVVLGASHLRRRS